MDPVVTLTEEQLVVEPGGEVSTVVRVRNASDIVTEYDLTVLGEIAAYTQIVPPQLSVYVGDMMEATVIIRPPYDTMISSGQIPFAIRVQSREDPDRIGMAEGELTVGAINLLQTKILPSQSTGRWRAKARLEIHNEGTEEMTVRLRTVDPDEKLSFALSPREIDIAAGATADAFVKIRPRKTMVMGTAEQIPFQISYRRKAGLRDAYLGATTAGETEAFVHSTFTKKPIVARWMVGAFALVLVLAGLFVWRAQTTEIDETPPQAIPAPQPPENVRLSADIGTISVTWEESASQVSGYRIISLDPQDYAQGSFVPIAEDGVVREDIDRRHELEVEEGTTKCLLVQAISEEGIDGPKSVLVGATSQSGIVEGDLPEGNCITAPTRDRCAPPVVNAPVFEGGPNNPRSWTVTWTYGEGCETADEASWTIRVNGEVVAQFDDPGQDNASLDLSDVAPVGGVYTVAVSPRDGEPGEEVTIDAGAVEEEAERIENLEKGIVDPRLNFAIVTSLNPSSRLPLTGPDSVEEWFEQIQFALTRPEPEGPGVASDRIAYGPVVESELPDDQSSNMRLIEIEDADNETAYYFVVDDFVALADAQDFCDEVTPLIAGIREAFVEQAAELGVVRPPEDCRAVTD